VPGGWDLTSATCDDDDGDDPGNIVLDPGETVTCAFADTKKGTIVVEKVTINDVAVFDFTSSTLGNFSLTTTDQNVPVNTTFADLEPGNYDVAETVPSGWNMTEAACSDGSDPGAIELGAGEEVTCTFEDTKVPPELGTIIVEKQTTPDESDESFEFSGDASGTIKDGEQIIVNDLEPGTYTSQEVNVPSGWELENIELSDNNSTSDLSENKVTFQLEAGEAVKATFYDKEIGPFDPLEMEKYCEDVDGESLLPGDEILWKIRVWNTGPIETVSVVVTDTVPENSTYVSGSITGRGADDSNVPDLVWNIGSLQVGEEVELAYRSSVNQGVPAGTEIRNYASVVGAYDSEQTDPESAECVQTVEQAEEIKELPVTGEDDYLMLLLALVAVITGGMIVFVTHRKY
jgi:uncharacterized repeat protein (TIGR01451 family)